MKIKEIRAFEVDLKRARTTTGVLQRGGRQPAAPTERYARYRGARSKAGAGWKQCACLVTLDDGTVGLGLGGVAGPGAPVIQDHFRDHLVRGPGTGTR
ncbi:MAG: hypothetical protein OXC31_10295, partial [Spirochaetaceae bacterium]|nr:hypothetical protein [Spirochaetaceae bacterium]